ncbi:MAG: hypothetical protein ACREXY_21555, partial [Gammaproteobacteria bacterium]
MAVEDLRAVLGGNLPDCGGAAAGVHAAIGVRLWRWSSSLGEFFVGVVGQICRVQATISSRAAAPVSRATGAQQQGVAGGAKQDGGRHQCR